MLGMIFFCVNTEIICFSVFTKLTCIHHQDGEANGGKPKLQTEKRK